MTPEISASPASGPRVSGNCAVLAIATGVSLLQQHSFPSRPRVFGNCAGLATATGVSVQEQHSFPSAAGLVGASSGWWVRRGFGLWGLTRETDPRRREGDGHERRSGGQTPARVGFSGRASGAPPGDQSELTLPPDSAALAPPPGNCAAPASAAGVSLQELHSFRRRGSGAGGRVPGAGCRGRGREDGGVPEDDGRVGLPGLYLVHLDPVQHVGRL
ncbi:hypothetical protein GCM10022236_46280 [Microlunatus ginsengisoli]|uniref:Uncharacterized protein n=1 Tax=Microlunatus ginsengisoli TaxID=363863 RepID=A0ABP7AR16_9ACTN